MAEQAPQAVPDQWHLQDAHELARQHGVDPAHGLHEEEASRRVARHGLNEIQARPGRGPLGLLLDQFKDFMIVVLIAAAVISGVIGDLVDTLAIRSETESLFRLGLGSNRPLLGAVLLTFVLQLATIYVPFLNPIFKTEPLSLAELLLCLGASAVVFVAVEIEKSWLRRKRPSPA